MATEPSEREGLFPHVSLRKLYGYIFYHGSMEKDTPCRSRLSVERKIFETPRSDQFDIKKVGIQTNKPLTGIMEDIPID